MIARQAWTLVISIVMVLVPVVPARSDGFPGGAREALGSRYDTAQEHEPSGYRRNRHKHDSISRLRYWNETAIDTSGIDHTPVGVGETRVFGQQLGPGRSSNAMAIVHIAMFEVVNAVAGRYQSYVGLAPAPHGASVDAAIATAAHDTLVALFPSHETRLDALLAEDLSQIAGGKGRAKQDGIRLGQRAAAAILAARAADGSHHSEPRVGIDFITSDEPGKWRQDPVSRIPLALGAHWGAVKPFVLRSGAQFRAPTPPSLDSPEYAAAFAEVKRLGGDGVVTPTERTDEQTQIGIYWAYDGTPSLCAPPRLYNQIATQIADQMGSDLIELARLLALVNTAMADAGVAIWESKYHYQYWRPVTGIRETPLVGDTTFSPLGAPASNLTGPNFTPPFPAYPSGHAGFGAALFQILRKFYGSDYIPFTFVSDELNGVTKDRNGNVRPHVVRSFSSLSQAEEENGQSRIYLGIHWAFDKTEGIAQGRRVADFVFKNAFAPVKEHNHSRRSQSGEGHNR